jgi:hypothetical protein
MFVPFSVFCAVTDQGSVFKSRTKRTDDKLSWSFGWLNYETRSLGYVAEQQSDVMLQSSILTLDRHLFGTKLLRSFNVCIYGSRGNLIRSKESEIARVDMYLSQLRLSAGS